MRWHRGWDLLGTLVFKCAADFIVSFGNINWFPWLRGEALAVTPKSWFEWKRTAEKKTIGEKHLRYCGTSGDWMRQNMNIYSYCVNIWLTALLSVLNRSLVHSPERHVGQTLRRTITKVEHPKPRLMCGAIPSFAGQWSYSRRVWHRRRREPNVCSS